MSAPGEIPDGRVPVLLAADIAAFASLSVIGPGAAAQVAREVRELAAPSLVRMDAMEAVVEAALAVVAPMARWQDQQLTTEEIALRNAVRSYQEVAS